MTNFNIKSLLLIITLGLSFALGLVGVIGIANVQTLHTSLNHVINQSVPIVRNITLVDMVHDGVNSSVHQLVLGLLVKDTKMIDEAGKALIEHEKNVKEEFEVILTSLDNPELIELGKQKEAAMKHYFEVARSVQSAIEKKDMKEVQASFKSFQQEFEVLEKSLGEFGEKAENYSKNEFVGALEDGNRSKTIMSIVLGAALLLGFSLSFIASKSLNNRLQLLVSKLLSGSGKVSETVKELVVSSDTLSSSSLSQASALQETSSAIEEISSMLQKSAENSTASETASHHSKDKAEKGHEVVERMITSIEEINVSNASIGEQVRESNVQISEIVRVIREIEDKTKIINDIVFQTKLLSFNASVEAARAGEHGKGFAVVAHEIGNLAQMSGNASKEISHLLEASVRKVETIAEETKTKVDKLISTATSKVSEGVNVAHECKEVLQEIVTSSNEVLGSISGISSASREQSIGVTEVSKSVQKIDSLTQANSDSAQVCGKAAKLLSEEANEVKGIAMALCKLAGIKVNQDTYTNNTQNSFDSETDTTSEAA